MKKFLYFFCICFFLSCKAWADVDNAMLEYALNAPDSISQDARRLTNYLVKPYKKDYDKLKIIAYWMATHIAYDGYRYDNETVYEETNRYKYDILKVKTGVCGDFARLFKEMATLAGVKNVFYVSGKTYKTEVLKKKYKEKKGEVGHAWNEAVIDGRHFYIDTTWMSHMHIGRDAKKKGRKSHLKHKRELKKRRRKETPVSETITDFYFDFSPQEEVRLRKVHHWVKNQNLKSFLPRGRWKAARQKAQMQAETAKRISMERRDSANALYFPAEKKEPFQKSYSNQPQTAMQGKRDLFAEIRKILWKNNNSLQQALFSKQLHLRPSQMSAESFINKENDLPSPSSKKEPPSKTLREKPPLSVNKRVPPAQKSLPAKQKTTNEERKNPFSLIRKKAVVKEKEVVSLSKKNTLPAQSSDKKSASVISVESTPVIDEKRTPAINVENASKPPEKKGGFKEKLHQANVFLKKQLNNLIAFIFE